MLSIAFINDKVEIIINRPKLLEKCLRYYMTLERKAEKNPQNLTLPAESARSNQDLGKFLPRLIFAEKPTTRSQN